MRRLEEALFEKSLLRPSDGVIYPAEPLLWLSDHITKTAEAPRPLHHITHPVELLQRLSNHIINLAEVLSRLSDHITNPEEALLGPSDHIKNPAEPLLSALDHVRHPVISLPRMSDHILCRTTFLTQQKCC